MDRNSDLYWQICPTPYAKSHLQRRFDIVHDVNLQKITAWDPTGAERDGSQSFNNCTEDAAQNRRCLLTTSFDAEYRGLAHSAEHLHQLYVTVRNNLRQSRTKLIDDGMDRLW